MKERLKIACHATTIRLSPKYAFTVGLTMLIPYLASTFSGVSVIYKLRCAPRPHEG
ncbi:MAG: hypothetical protein Q9M29_07005 [Mariprofundaceae bacterium]|nr:hypothetical protein [Mariprofundaceae bacterium]